MSISVNANSMKLPFVGGTYLWIYAQVTGFYKGEEFESTSNFFRAFNSCEQQTQSFSQLCFLKHS